MPQQKIFTASILYQLAKNGAATRAAQAAGKDEPQHKPVIKVFNPYGPATWLLTESEPGEPDRLYGLCDLGMGSPELGNVLRSEIEGMRIMRGGFGLKLERDAHFTADMTIEEYAEAARLKGSIAA
jgi:hypothetical protein